MKTRMWLVKASNVSTCSEVINEIVDTKRPVGVLDAYKFVCQKFFGCDSLDESSPLVIELFPIYTSYTCSPYGIGDVDYTK